MSMESIQNQKKEAKFIVDKVNPAEQSANEKAKRANRKAKLQAAKKEKAHKRNLKQKSKEHYGQAKDFGTANSKLTNSLEARRFKVDVGRKDSPEKIKIGVAPTNTYNAGLSEKKNAPKVPAGDLKLKAIRAKNFSTAGMYYRDHLEKPLAKKGEVIENTKPGTTPSESGGIQPHPRQDNTNLVARLKANRKPIVTAEPGGRNNSGISARQLLNVTGFGNAAAHLSNVAKEANNVKTSEQLNAHANNTSAAVNKYINEIKSNSGLKDLASHIPSLEQISNDLKSGNAVKIRNAYVQLNSKMREVSKQAGTPLMRKPRASSSLSISQKEANRQAKLALSKGIDYVNALNAKATADENERKLENASNKHRSLAEQKYLELQAAQAEQRAAIKERDKRKDNVAKHLSNLSKSAGNDVYQARQEAIKKLGEAGIKLSKTANKEQMLSALRNSLTEMGASGRKNAGLKNLGKLIEQVSKENAKRNRAEKKNRAKESKNLLRADVRRQLTKEPSIAQQSGLPAQANQPTPSGQSVQETQAAPAQQVQQGQQSEGQGKPTVGNPAKEYDFGTSKEERGFVKQFRKQSEFLKANKDKIAEAKEVKAKVDANPSVTKEEQKLAKNFDKNISTLKNNSKRINELKARQAKSESENNKAVSQEESDWATGYKAKQDFIAKNKGKAEKLLAKQQKSANALSVSKEDSDFASSFKRDKNYVDKHKERYDTLSAKSQNNEKLSKAEDHFIKQYEGKKSSVSNEDNQKKFDSIQQQLSSAKKDSRALTKNEETFLNNYQASRKDIEGGKDRYADIKNRQSSYIAPLSQAEKAEISAHEALQKYVNEMGAKVKDIKKRSATPSVSLTKEQRDILKRAAEAESTVKSKENRAKYFGIARKSVQEATDKAKASLESKYRKEDEQKKQQRQALKNMGEALQNIHNIDKATTKARSQYLGESEAKAKAAEERVNSLGAEHSELSKTASEIHNNYTNAIQENKDANKKLSDLRHKFSENRSKIDRQILPDFKKEYTPEERKQLLESYQKQQADLNSGKSNYDYKNQEQKAYEAYKANNPNFAAIFESSSPIGGLLKQYKGIDHEGEDNVHGVARDVSNTLKRERSAVRDLLTARLTSARESLERLNAMPVEQRKADGEVTAKNGKVIKTGWNADKQRLEQRIANLEKDYDITTGDNYGNAYTKIAQRELQSAERINKAVNGKTPVAIAEAAKEAKRRINALDTDYDERRQRDLQEREIGIRTKSRKARNNDETSENEEGTPSDATSSMSSQLPVAAEQQQAIENSIIAQNNGEDGENTGLQRIINTTKLQEQAQKKYENKFENKIASLERRDTDNGVDSSLVALVHGEKAQLDKTKASLERLQQKHDNIANRIAKHKDSLNNIASKSDDELGNLAYETALKNKVNEIQGDFFENNFGSSIKTSDKREPINRLLQKYALKEFNLPLDKLSGAQRNNLEDRLYGSSKSYSGEQSGIAWVSPDSIIGKELQKNLANAKRTAEKSLDKSQFKVNNDNREQLQNLVKESLTEQIKNLQEKADIIAHGSPVSEDDPHGRKTLASLAKRVDEEQKRYNHHNAQLESIIGPGRQEERERNLQLTLGRRLDEIEKPKNGTATLHTSKSGQETVYTNLKNKGLNEVEWGLTSDNPETLQPLNQEYLQHQNLEHLMNPESHEQKPINPDNKKDVVEMTAGILPAKLGKTKSGEQIEIIHKPGEKFHEYLKEEVSKIPEPNNVKKPEKPEYIKLKIPKEPKLIKEEKPEKPELIKTEKPKEPELIKTEKPKELPSLSELKKQIRAEKGRLGKAAEKKAIHKAKEKYRKDLDQYNTDVKSNEEKIAQYRKDLDQYNTDVKSNAKSNKEKITQYNKDLARYNTDLKSNKEKITQYNKDLAQYKANVKSNKEKIAQYNKDLDQFRADLKTNQEIAKQYTHDKHQYDVIVKLQKENRHLAEYEAFPNKDTLRMKREGYGTTNFGDTEFDGDAKSITAKLKITPEDFPQDADGQKEANRRWALNNLAAIMDESESNSQARGVVDKYFNDLGIGKKNAEDVIKRLAYSKDKVSEIALNPESYKPISSLSFVDNVSLSESDKVILSKALSDKQREEYTKKFLELYESLSADEYSDANYTYYSEHKNIDERKQLLNIIDKAANKQISKEDVDNLYAFSSKLYEKANDDSDSRIKNCYMQAGDLLTSIADNIDDGDTEAASKIAKDNDTAAIKASVKQLDSLSELRLKDKNVAIFAQTVDLSTKLEDDKKAQARQAELDKQANVLKLADESAFSDVKAAKAKADALWNEQTEVSKKYRDTIKSIKESEAELAKVTDPNEKKKLEVQLAEDKKSLETLKDDYNRLATESRQAKIIYRYARVLDVKAKRDAAEKKAIEDGTKKSKSELKALNKELIKVTTLYAKDERDSVIKNLGIAEREKAEKEAAESGGSKTPVSTGNILDTLAEKVDFVKTKDGVSVKPTANPEELAKSDKLSTAEKAILNELVQASKERYAPAKVEKMSEETKSAMKTLRKKGEKHNKIISEGFFKDAVNVARLKALTSRYKELKALQESLKAQKTKKSQTDIDKIEQRMQAARDEVHSLRTVDEKGRKYGVRMSPAGYVSFFRERKEINRITGQPKRDYGYNYIGDREYTTDRQGGRLGLVMCGLRGR